MNPMDIGILSRIAFSILSDKSTELIQEFYGFWGEGDFDVFHTVPVNKSSVSFEYNVAILKFQAVFNGRISPNILNRISPSLFGCYDKLLLLKALQKCFCMGSGKYTAFNFE